MYQNAQMIHIMDLLMDLVRGAVFRHGGGAGKQPIKQPTEKPTSTMASKGRFPSLSNGSFSDLNGAVSPISPQGAVLPWNCLQWGRPPVQFS